MAYSSGLNFATWDKFSLFSDLIIVTLTQYLLNRMSTQNPILVDSPDDPLHQEWNEREWISVGKKYPVSGEVPAFIKAARSKVLAVPLTLDDPQFQIFNELRGKLQGQSKLW